MDENKIDIKDIYASYWRCTDFELSNLWQRSIFLTAFLVLCFTAYGAILSKIRDNIEPGKSISFLILNGISYCISLIGIIFSILWIKMGKGSKAWYERYEGAIKAIERNAKYASDEATKIGGFSYENLDNYNRPKVDNVLFKNTAGAYSVSRINIAIGQVFLILWLVIGLVHLIAFANKLICIESYVCVGWSLFFVGLFLLILTPLIFGHYKMFRSNTIS